MKNSKEYSQEIRKLYRSLKRKHKKVQPDIYDDPVDGLIYAIISEQMSQAATQSVIKKFADYFIDQNDLRVSRAEEVVAALGEDTPVTRDIALALTKALRTVFDKYHTVSSSLQGHAIPLTRKMIDYLRHNELVHPDADDQQIEGFLAKQISAENAYEFYALLRRESESRRARRKKAARTTGMKAATKTKRKTRKTKLRKK
jgi:hypothetical protein